jgi:hypothetical protein
MRLMIGGIVLEMVDDRYMLKRHTVTGNIYKNPNEIKALYATLDLLAKESGKHTFTEIGRIIIDKTHCTSVEFSLLFTELAAANYLLIDQFNKVWSAADPPLVDDKEDNKDEKIKKKKKKKD